MDAALVLVDADREAPGKAALAGMLLVSAGAMVVEIALTRLFSLVFFYHYAFLVIGLAMLGLAVGGLLVWRQSYGGGSSSTAPCGWAALAGLATSGATVLLVLVAPRAGLPAYAAFAALPFTLVGATTAAALARYPGSSGHLYAADLAGAALGTLLSVVLLQLVGGVNALLAAAALIGWGGPLLVAHDRLARAVYLAGACLLSLIAALNPLTGKIDVSLGAIDAGKTMSQQLTEQGRIVYTRWDAFARTDVVAAASNPGEMLIFLDGGAGAAMYRFAGDLSSVPAPLRGDVGFFPYLDRPAGEVLDIGPGGGKDVLMALVAGATRVTAVEVNPGTVEAVRHFSDFNGGIYDRPEVEVVVDEGRSYLKRSSQRYDTIYLSLTMAQVAERTGYALTENYLYTVEAIQDYLNHLKPNGQLVFKLHSRADLERVIRTATKALEETGVPKERVSWYLEAVVAEANLHGMFGDDVMFPVLVIRRDPYTTEEVQLRLSSWWSSEFLPLYTPGVGGVGPLATLGTAADPAVAGDPHSGADLSPTTDDRPFFYQYAAGPPLVSLAVLAVTLLLAALSWRVLRGTIPAARASLRPSLAYFGCLGLAFMLVEVTLIQKLTLFLGHPTVAVTTVLFALLVSGAAGSWISSRAGAGHRLTMASAALAAGLALAYTQVLPWATSMTFSWTLLPRILAAGALIAPLGLFMGMPFPTALQTLAKGSPAPLATLAWTANGFASVFGSALAIVLATLFGFTTSLVVGGVAYLTAALLAALMTRAQVDRPSELLDEGHTGQFILPPAASRQPL